MGIYLNFIFAWISILLSLLLSVIYILRIFSKKSDWIRSLNRFLRRHHIVLGISLILTGLLHGIFSSEKVLTFNLGTICWILSMLLGLNYLCRSIFKKKSLWIVYHRILTVIFIISIVLHIIDVGGIQVHRLFEKHTEQKTEITYTPKPIKHATTPQITITPSPSFSPSPTPTATEVQENTRRYTDGTYRGTAKGYREGLVVEVTIKDGKIISVEVIEHNEVNKKFWGYPVEVIPNAIVESQSTDVDIISGATYTSKGIMKATENALKKARKND
jgi:uncharacterized protein with FMN-binding domain